MDENSQDQSDEPRQDNQAAVLKTERKHVLQYLADRLLFVAITLGVAVVIAVIVRASTSGWRAEFFFDLINYGLVVTVLLLRKKIPLTLLFWILVVLFASHGIMSLALSGLASAGMIVMASTCIMIGVFFGLRAGIVFLGLTALTLLTIGTLHHYEVLSPAPNIKEYLSSPSTWAIQGLVLAAFVLSAVFAANAVQQRLSRSLGQLRSRTEKLRETNARLIESEKQFRVLSENVSDMVFKQNLDLQPVYTSPSVATVLGYTQEEAMKLGMQDIMTKESLAQAFETYGAYLEKADDGPVDVPLMEFEYIKKDRSTFWGELKVSFTYDEDGKVSGSQGVLRDISDRKRIEEDHWKLEEELRQSEKMRALGQLAGGVAHDFNNQLAAIMGFASLIRASKLESPKLRKHAESIIQSSRRASDLTAKLLAFSRSGRQQSKEVDLHFLLNETVEMLERSIDKKIRITTNLKAKPSITLGDPTLLQSALLNLGLNARDAMPNGGELAFETTVLKLDVTYCKDRGSTISPGEYIEIIVRDTGSGMNLETQSRIFEPFFTTKDPGSGTGMGLAAVDGTIRSHSGEVMVESELGKGTVFVIHLPLVDNESEEELENTRDLAPLIGTGTIMVLDDDSTVLEMTEALLTTTGYKVTSFTDPKKAVEFYESNTDEVDLVLLDMVMPDMNGTQVFKTIRDKNPHARVLLFSGFSMKTDSTELLAKGAVGFLQKPFTLKTLSKAVAEALN